MNKYAIFGIIVLVAVVTSFWVSDRLHFRKINNEKAETIRILQEKLSKCTSNSIVFEGKVKKSDLNLRQLFRNKAKDTCQTDTISIVKWWGDLSPKERRRYRKQL